MNNQIKAKDNPRVIAIQKIYGKFYNENEEKYLLENFLFKFLISFHHDFLKDAS